MPLASIQEVLDVEPIEGSDFIELVKVLGWELIAKKGEFQKGSSCVYFEIDSVVPNNSVFSFLHKEDISPEKRRRIRTKKMRGVISQGLALPLDILKEFDEDSTSCSVGDDVTDIIGVQKFEHKSYINKSGDIKGGRPVFVVKTDEDRIQSYPRYLDKIKDRDICITQKLDGMSASYYYKDGIVGVCSRNLHLREPKEGDKISPWWYVESKYNIFEKLQRYGRNIVVQGEICGPGIQENRLQLDDTEFFVFDVIDIDRNSYNSHMTVKTIAENLGLKTVPFINTIHVANDIDSKKLQEDLMKIADTHNYYGTNQTQEGIVVRLSYPQTASLHVDKRLSFKVVSNKYLLKNKE